MSERRKEIYVSGDVLHSLILIAKSKSNSTADEIADCILLAHIQTYYPQLLEHEKQVYKMEKEVVASLSTTAGKAPTDAKQ